MSVPDDAGVRFPPPLIFLGFILAGLAIDVVLGGSSIALSGWLRWSIVAAPATAGLFLVATALALFRKAGTRPEPWEPSTALSTSGVYARTRNPMYLGMACLHVAIAFALGSLAALLLLIPALVIIDRMVIQREEIYLERRFGRPYLDYKARVRRWI